MLNLYRQEKKHSPCIGYAAALMVLGTGEVYYHLPEHAGRQRIFGLGGHQELGHIFLFRKVEGDMGTATPAIPLQEWER